MGMQDQGGSVARTGRRRSLLEGWSRGGQVPLDRLDPLLDVPPLEFEERVQALPEDLARLEIRLVPEEVPVPRPAAAFSVLSERDSYAQEVFSLPRLDREGEYRMARRYALVKNRFQHSLEALGLDSCRGPGGLDSFICRDVPATAEGGPELCPHILEKVGPAGARRIRERCREFNQVRNGFIEGCLYIVLLSLSSFRFPGVAREDLIQEGNASLFRAVDRYDWSKGVRFRTYAEYWVHQAFLEAVYNQSRTVRVPAWVQKATRKIRQAQARAGLEVGEGEEDVVAAQALGLEPEKVADILRDNRRTVSLDRESGDEEGSGGSLLESMGTGADASEEAAAREENQLLPERMKELLGTLPQRERHVLELRFGLGGFPVHTLTEVGEKLGVSAERVRQIQANALRRLQEPGRRKRLTDFT